MTAKRTYVVDARTATPHFPGIGRYVRGLIPALAAQLAPGERLAILCTDDAQIADTYTDADVALLKAAP